MKKGHTERKLSPEETQLHVLIQSITPKKKLDGYAQETCTTILNNLPKEERSKVMYVFRERAKEIGTWYVRLFFAFLEDLAKTLRKPVIYIEYAIREAGSLFGFLKKQNLLSTH